MCKEEDESIEGETHELEREASIIGWLAEMRG